MSFPFSSKLLTLLVCLAYLFIGAGGARAFIWCSQSDGSFRAEFKPAGGCGSDCDDAAQEDPSGPASEDVTDAHGGADCRDIPFLQAQAKKVRACDEEILQVSSLPPVVLPAFSPRFFDTGTRLLISPQPPPPSPMLAALRTVVLLN